MTDYTLCWTLRTLSTSFPEIKLNIKGDLICEKSGKDS